MEYYYNGEKVYDLTETLAILLEEHDCRVIDENLDTFIEMCEKKEFPYRYFTDNIVDLDKILDDEEYLDEVIMNYEIKKANY